AVHKERGDRLVRAATTTSSLEADQDSGNIDKTQSNATPNEPSPRRTTSGGGPRVLDLEKTKITQALEITSLKRRVKKLEKKQRSKTHKLKRLYKVGLIARVDTSQDEQSLDTNTIKLIVDVAHVSAVGKVNAASIATTVSATATITIEEITLAQALVEIKTSKPKAKEIVLQEPKFDEEQRLVRERAQKELKANIALIETYDDVQAKIMLIINWLKDCKQKNNKN
nr:hypothetical protein [Tanacetum cinerariifolium]